MKRLHRYSLLGFRLQVSPGRWRVSDMYFTFEGARVQIFAVEVFDDNGMFLGTVQPFNLSLDTIKFMVDYAKRHRNNWRKIPNNFLV